MSSVDEESLRTSSGTTLLLAALSAAAAAIHFSVLQVHAEEAAVFGVFFSIVAVAQLAWALAIVVTPNRTLLVAGAWGNALVAVVWVVSRVVGVPFGAHPWEAEPVTFIDSAATACEVLIALLVLARTRLEGWVPVAGGIAALLVATSGIAVTDPHVHIGSGLEPGEIERSALSGARFDGEISTVPLYGGYVEGFLERPSAGDNAIHVGFFTRSGAPLAVETFELSAASDTAEAEIDEIERLASSHFVAPVELTAGKWTFRVRAVTATGQAFTTRFEQRVRA